MKEKLKWHEGRESAEKDERINKTLQAEKEKVLLERPNVIQFKAENNPQCALQKVGVFLGCYWGVDFSVV